MNIEEARKIAAGQEALAGLIGWRTELWPSRCHGVSLALVKAKAFGYGRVARGVCQGVGGQHSWIVLHRNVYKPTALIVDPTLQFNDPSVKGIWVGTMSRDGRHHPKGMGSIWVYGHPRNCHPADAIEIKQDELSKSARLFLELLGPLDKRGWMQLMDGPMEGWPAAEIIPAVLATPRLETIVPVDIIGHLTDLNPQGLYLAD